MLSLSVLAHFVNFRVQFSRRGYGVSVKPGDTASLEYYFYPNPNLENMEIIFVADVIYEVEGSGFYKSTFLNSTIELLEKPAEWDFGAILSYVLFAAIFGLVAYILITVFSTSTAKAVKAVVRRTSQSSAPGQVDLDDFLPDYLKPKADKKNKKQ
jgi:hypothetical protein